MINVILGILAVFMYHEAGHFFASERYGVTEGVAIVYHSNLLKRPFTIGPAVIFDESELTERQVWIVLLAPLLWAIPAVISYAVYTITIAETFLVGAIIMGFAAGMALLSDMPMHLSGTTTNPDMKIKYLWKPNT